MRDYSESSEYVVRRVWFDYQGTRFEGRGVLTWDPEKGFHLEAPVKPKQRPSKRDDFNYSGVLRPEHYRPIRMELSSGRWARARRVGLVDRTDVWEQGRLSVSLSHVLFCTPLPSKRPAGYELGGRALYSVGQNLKGRMPDKVEEVVLLDGQQWEERFERSGIHYESPSGQRVVGRVLAGEHLDLSYRVSTGAGASGAARRWARAAADALSILSGFTVRLLRRQVYRGTFSYEDVWRQEQAAPLGQLAPVATTARIARETLIDVANFLSMSERGADVCRGILGHLEAAAAQKYLQARELVLATALEGALRTLYGIPFQLHVKNIFKARKALKRFREEYLSPEWEAECDRVLPVYERLRHSNAHPDWLYEERGAFLHSNLQQGYEDAMLLARFYGVMMLALAGIPNLRPNLLDLS